MITSISFGAGQNDLGTQARIRRRALRRRTYRLRQKVSRAVRLQRESAVINYLSAKRFPPKSKEALILRLLAQSALHRKKKLETVLSHFSNATKRQPRRWLFDWTCFYVAHAPRFWLLLWLKRHHD